MSVYYNEFDRAKAAWLRHLIEEGAIAHGVVDECPIQAVDPDDLRGYAQCHFFAGIGLWSLCLRRAGWADDRPVWTGSCPCGPFSVAGKGEGFADPRHLWPEWFRLIGQRRPDVLFGEQSDAADAWLDLVSTDLEGIGYAFGPADIPAAGFGGAHKRQRFGFVADAHHSERWADRAPWHDGIWPQTGRVKGAGDARDGGAGGWMAHAHGRRLAQQPEHDGANAARGVELDAGPGAVRRGHLLGLGDAGGDGPAADAGDDGEVRGLQEAQRQSEHGAALSRRPSPFGGLVDPASGRQRVGPCGVGYLYQPDRSGSADWLLCRDSRWRPVEPGLSPLVDAHPARMGLLRGYGDAIDVEAFTNLIGAFMDAAADLATQATAA